MEELFKLTLLDHVSAFADLTRTSFSAHRITSPNAFGKVSIRTEDLLIRWKEPHGTFSNDVNSQQEFSSCCTFGEVTRSVITHKTVDTLEADVAVLMWK